MANFIFSLLGGISISLLTIAAAWIKFKPLAGITLMTCVGISIYLLGFFDWDRKFGAGYREHTSHH